MINKNYDFKYYDRGNISYRYNGKYEVDKYSDIDIRALNLICSNSSISEVNKYRNLSKLICNNTLITDVSKLVNLKKLQCSDTPISDISMLTNLQVLHCNNTLISDVLNEQQTSKGLSTLINLKTLVCSNTDISDISLLVDLSKLNCIGTYITDVSMLPKLKEVKTDLHTIKVHNKTKVILV
jgi:Leucine-rich repeat (LRR) protein